MEQGLRSNKIMRIFSKARKPRKKTHINDPRIQEVTFLGEPIEIDALSKWCTDNNIEFKVKRTIFNTEIRFICSDPQLTHISLVFL
jgi:hypothetical protein